MSKFEITELEIPEVKLIRPKKFEDDRGFFSETYNKKELAESGIDLDFVQDNHSYSRDRGVIRGLHYQEPPFAQDKLVRVVRGSILDVAVDIRRGSPTFGKYVTAVLSAENWTQILVPIGFAHAICTLEANTEIIYKVTNYYSPQHDKGVAWDDPDIGIDWPIAPDEVMLSDKDRQQPLLKDVVSPFEFAG